MTTPRKRPTPEDTQGMRDWMIDQDYKLDTLLHWMEQSLIRQEKHAPFIERMMKEEEDRDMLYKSIRSKVVGSGAVGALSMLCAIVWYAVTHWLAK